MLEKAISQTVKKSALQEMNKELSESLPRLQLKIKEQNRPVILVFEGWEASGKGSVISSVIKYLDPRFFKVFTVEAPDEAEKRYPFMKRHWGMIPEKGKISVLDKSW